MNHQLTHSDPASTNAGARARMDSGGPALAAAVPAVAAGADAGYDRVYLCPQCPQRAHGEAAQAAGVCGGPAAGAAGALGGPVGRLLAQRSALPHLAVGAALADLRLLRRRTLCAPRCRALGFLKPYTGCALRRSPRASLPRSVRRVYRACCLLAFSGSQKSGRSVRLVNGACCLLSLCVCRIRQVSRKQQQLPHAAVRRCRESRMSTGCACGLRVTRPPVICSLLVLRQCLSMSIENRIHNNVCSLFQGSGCETRTWQRSCSRCCGG